MAVQQVGVTLAQVSVGLQQRISPGNWQASAQVFSEDHEEYGPVHPAAVVAVQIRSQNVRGSSTQHCPRATAPEETTNAKSASRGSPGVSTCAS